VAGSPDLGVLPVSLTSIRSSYPSRSVGLAGPRGSRLNRMDLPCSRPTPWLHADGKIPGEHLSPLVLAWVPLSSLLRSRSISGLCSRLLSLRPATSLSTLRSGRYRPTTQDSVRGARYALPRPSFQTIELNALARHNPHRTGRADLPLTGSSRESFAHGGVTIDAVRDSLVKPVRLSDDVLCTGL